MNEMKEVYIVAAKRTPTGSFLGSLSHLSATQLGAMAIKAALQQAALPPDAVDAVWMGNVLSANLGQSPARQAALNAGVADHTDCTTINKVCASGLKAVISGAQQIQLDQCHTIVAGGMESMSNTPHYSLRRNALKLGDELTTDGILKDGLIDAYSNKHMGFIAEAAAREYNLSRLAQDDYALQSYARAAQATQQKKFAAEIIPIQRRQDNGLIEVDEDIYKVIPQKVPTLKPVFEETGTITAANASNLNDGAAALVLASKTAVYRHNLKPLARIVAYADAAQAPDRYTTAPVPAITSTLARANMKLSDIDFFEINEAYAAMILANQKLLNLDLNKLNIYGGAIAIGHPLGASGARILCTLVSALHQESGTYGLAAICNGGGGASALLIQRI